MKRLLLVVLVVLCALVLVRCGSSPTATPAPSASTTKPAEQQGPVLYTAQEAFTRLNGFAHKWAPDAMPINLVSQLTSEADGRDGRATIWHAMFASPSRGTVKAFVCSGSRLPDAPALGTSAGAAESPLTYELRGRFFEAFMFKTDSKQAFEVTQKNGGDRVLKKDPKTHINYVLEWDRKQNAPLWYVVYGETLKQNNGVGVVNATTGTFLQAKK